jgi:UDP-MurNAc hydroxylase
MLVEFLGHAGIAVTVADTTLLMDCWFSREGAFDASWFQLPANHHLGERDWSGVAGAIVSHEHLDHLDPAFLRSLPESKPLYIPAYGSALFPRKVIQTTGRRPTILRPGEEHILGDLRVRVWVEDSPINQDSVWVFRHGGLSVVHTVDSRLTPAQLDEIRDYLGATPDLLLLQCSGASWYPLVYENYDDESKRARSLRKREQKLSYALSVARQLTPTTVVVCAGPPVFLDPELRRFNDDPSFPLPSDAREWFRTQGYAGRIETPLPGDKIDLRSGEMRPDSAIHDRFSWERTPEYTAGYVREMASHVTDVYRRADAIAVDDLYAAFEAHFRRMLRLSPYFNERINMTLRFDVEGEQGGVWLVDVGANPDVRRGAADSPYHYRYRLHERWLKRIVIDGVPWEDFFLSLRFAARREPDVYNDHLLGLLKFNDGPSLRAVEQYEKCVSDETITVTAADGTRYEISKYCPHAGASMEAAPVEGDTITCLNHHYVFDLKSGRCLTGNCVIRSRRLP